MKNKTTVKNLLDLIPESYFEEIAKKTNVDFQVKKLHGKLMFNLLLMGILQSERLSLRVLEELYASQKFQSFAGLTDSETTRHSSIRDRIATIDCNYFEELFGKIAALLDNKYKSNGKGNHKIQRFDSTIVSLSSKLLKFGMYSGKPNKEGIHQINQLKFTIGFNGLIPVNVKTYTEQKFIGENDTLYETIMDAEFKKNTIAVFDRGLNSRNRFDELNKASKQFVTRINPTTNFKTNEIINTQHLETDTLIIEQDLKVYLKNRASKYMTTPLRLVISKTKESSEPMYFISNMFDISAEEITEIYKMRWDIEVFFRFLKQELNFSHLVARSVNGISVMLYMTLITAMMLLVYKQENKLPGYKICKIRFVNELDNELLKDIIIACNGDPSLIGVKKTS